jgi:hypothetical protein
MACALSGSYHSHSRKVSRLDSPLPVRIIDPHDEDVRADEEKYGSAEIAKRGIEEQHAATLAAQAKASWLAAYVSIGGSLIALVGTVPVAGAPSIICARPVISSSPN